MPRFMRYDPRFQYYNPYQRPNFYNNYRPLNTPPTPAPVQPSSQPQEEISSSNRGSQKSQKKTNPSDTVWLDVFGIKLYFDDVLILSLLYFLYEEEVKDEGLFLALVLLLIS